MEKSPTLEHLADALKQRAAETYTVDHGKVSVTVDAKYQVVAVTIHDDSMAPDQREALQADMIAAVNAATRAAVMAAARVLGSLPGWDTP